MKIYLLLCVVLTLNISCSETKNSSQPSSGGTDIGGSNTILGEPIESYIVDVTLLPEYKERIQDVITRLDILLPSFSRVLKSSLYVTRTWYVVPVELKKLSNVNIGIPFEQETEQYALHTQNAVWISDIERSKIADSNLAATHIMHEMIMSIRVDQNLKNKSISSKEFLSAKDYDDIRGLTNLLMSQNYTSADLQNYLFKRGFYYSSELNPDADKFPLPSEELYLKTLDQVFNFISSQKHKDLPNISSDYYYQKFIGYCVFKFDTKNKSLELNIYDVGYNKVLKTLAFQFSELTGRDEKGSDIHLNFVETNKFLSLYISDNKLSSVSITQKEKSKFGIEKSTVVCSKRLE